MGPRQRHSDVGKKLKLGPEFVVFQLGSVFSGLGGSLSLPVW